MQRKDIVIVTPALAEANDGNGQFAHRRARMLRGCHGLRQVATWGGSDEAGELWRGPSAPIKVQAALESPGFTT